MRDAKKYVEGKKQGEGYAMLAKRVEDVEHDLALLKRTVHEVEGMEVDKSQEENDETVKGKSIWRNLELRTISRMMGSPIDSPSVDSDRRRATAIFSSVGNVGRSFSASVIGAPRKVSGLAGGLYRGPRGSAGARDRVREKDALMREEEEDDVE